MGCVVVRAECCFAIFPCPPVCSEAVLCLDLDLPITVASDGAN